MNRHTFKTRIGKTGILRTVIVPSEILKELCHSFIPSATDLVERARVQRLCASIVGFLADSLTFFALHLARMYSW